MTDGPATIKYIREYLPTKLERSIKITERIQKPAVYDLTTSDLKRLGISVDEDTNIVVIKPVNGEIDKLADQLLADYREGSMSERSTIKMIRAEKLNEILSGHLDTT